MYNFFIIPYNLLSLIKIIFSNYSFSLFQATYHNNTFKVILLVISLITLQKFYHIFSQTINPKFMETFIDKPLTYRQDCLTCLSNLIHFLLLIPESVTLINSGIISANLNKPLRNSIHERIKLLW